MKVRIRTYQVQRVTYEVDVENEAGAEEAARMWFEEGRTLGDPVSEEMDDYAALVEQLEQCNAYYEELMQ